MTNPFSPQTSTWFSETFGHPTEIQRRGWETIADGEHALLVAPTGSGKTLAAFLWAIDQIGRAVDETVPHGVQVVYISPLKALVYDIERNLRSPLAGITRVAERLGAAQRRATVDVRTGDTPQTERRAQAKHPGDILVTTPESLYLLLGSKARANFAAVHTVIVDEIHALAPTKRGAHLALSLERLTALAAVEPQRIGLSATVRPREEVARFLGGAHRKVSVVDASRPPDLDLQVVVPVPDMSRVDPTPAARTSILSALHRDESPPAERGIWPAIYPRLVETILAHRSSIIFVNSRGLCERLASRINELAGEALVLAHHGSVSHEKRAEMEEQLKRGELRGIVATSSLELGIDMGAVDTVMLIESPGSVARGLQRVGRAGHQVGGRSIGRIYPKHKGDLLECAVVGQRMRAGEIEAIAPIASPLDVLAQQLVAIVCDEPRHIDELLELVRLSYPYRSLSHDALVAVLDMLSGRYPSDEFTSLSPRLSWDRGTDRVHTRRGTAMLSRLNAGTIPDRGLYGVFLGEDGPRVGELDEEMVFETRLGDRIILGASTWAVEHIGRDRIVVAPAPGEPGRMPFWHGDGPGRPVELGRALGRLARELGEQRPKAMLRYIRQHTPLDALAAQNLVDYIVEQKEHTGSLPTDLSLTVERFRDELGDWRVCILSPFGTPVHAPWAMALQSLLSARAGFEVQVMYTDDGIVLRFADTESLPEVDALFPDPDEVEDLVTHALADTALFASLFRENAARSLLLPRRRPDQRNPLWAQRRKAQALLASVAKYPGFAIVIETYRQALADLFDLEGLKALLRDIERRRIRVHEVETPSASPFARALVFAYVANYIYEQDAPLAERKAQALTLDRALLNELLGSPNLRELIDLDALTELEQDLQRLEPTTGARDADELHDRLRVLGDLTREDLQHRAPPEAVDAWLAKLERARRAVVVNVAGERRWIAAEDAGVYRDALGAAPPAGLPASFLEEVPDALERLLRRYARTHGPFLPSAPAGRFAMTPAQVMPALQLLESEGVLVRGEIRPGGSDIEWCDTGVLRALKRRTLARLRNEVAAVESNALARFLPQWHGIASPRPPHALPEAIAQLEGLSLPWSTLVDTLLPARILNFEPAALDQLSATGRVIWIGKGALGTRDGRIALYRREQVAVLVEPNDDYSPSSPAHAAALAHLAARGASFAFELEAPIKHAMPDIQPSEIDALLWDLVWAGLITNDTFQPLISLRRSGPRRRAAEFATGRWSLVSGLVSASSDTARTVARANLLLERYGIVSREAVNGETLRGGFSPIYRALSAMEETGKVRRGYFVEGLSGAQFAQPGAVEQARAARSDTSPAEPTDDDVLCLAALDPANPYGTLLPWPAAQSPRRIPGAFVVLAQGEPVLYLGPQARALTTFEVPSTLGNPEAQARLLALAFTALTRANPTGRRRSLRIERIDGVPARESPLRASLEAIGFRSDPRGLVSPGAFDGEATMRRGA